MTDKWEPEKPKAVVRAEWALGAWAAWLCLFGVYQSWSSLPGVQTMITEQLQGAISISSETLLEITIAGYALLALTMIWFVFKIGQGKKWARSSLLLSCVLQTLWTAWPPYHGVIDYLPDVPDLGLQFYALYLLYTWPGRTWFTREAWAYDRQA